MVPMTNPATTDTDRELLEPVVTDILELDYLGRKISVHHRSREVGRFSSRKAHYYATIDGRRTSRLYTPDREGPSPTDEAAHLAKKAKKIVDGWIADDLLRPALEAEIVHWPMTATMPTIEQRGTYTFKHEWEAKRFVIGSRVVAHSRGCYRLVVVEKTTATKVTVAYVTSRGGQITRKILKPNEIAVAR